MIGKNRYYCRLKISETKFRQLVRLFALDLTATDAAELTGLSIRSTNAIYQRTRHAWLKYAQLNTPSQVNSRPMSPASGLNAFEVIKVAEQAAKPLCLVF